jgi:hypothetical protein
MTDKAKKPTGKAIERWEDEGGATTSGPQTSRKKRPRDFAQRAKMIVDIAAGEIEDREPTPEEQGKDPAAVSLGRRGGLKGGKARAKTLSAERKTAIARKAAKARWGRRTS